MASRATRRLSNHSPCAVPQPPFGLKAEPFGLRHGTRTTNLFSVPTAPLPPLNLIEPFGIRLGDRGAAVSVSVPLPVFGHCLPVPMTIRPESLCLSLVTGTHCLPVPMIISVGTILGIDSQRLDSFDDFCGRARRLDSKSKNRF
jgi:hypothetical protein